MINEMTFEIEVIVDVGVDRGDLLQRLHLTKAQHRPFSSAKGQVTALDPVIDVPADILALAIAQLIRGGAI
jgi:hypothetical protein